MARSTRKLRALRGVDDARPENTNAVRIPHDPINESVVIAAIIVDEATRSQYLQSLPASMFFGTGHALIWSTLQELYRNGLHYDPATMRQLGGPDVDVTYLEDLLNQRPALPPNLDHHLEMLRWDHVRIGAAKGPVTRFLELLKDPKTSPDELKATASLVSDSFGSYGGPSKTKAWPDLVSIYEGMGTERNWFAEGAIEGPLLGLFIGPEKSHKSWALMQLAIATVAGKKWLGAFECKKPGPVCYVDMEYGEREFLRRMVRICRGMGLDYKDVLPHIQYEDDRSLRLTGDVVLLSGETLTEREKEQRRPLRTLVRRLVEDPVQLVIFDPLRNLLVGNENDSETVLGAFAALDFVRNHAKAPVIVSHHLNKASGYSGSRALLSRADLILEGSDEEVPWYGAKGRTLRHGDKVSTRFCINVRHDDDNDNSKAATTLTAKFVGKESLSKGAERMLDALQRTQGGASVRSLRASTKQNYADAKKALAELEEVGLAEVQKGKWDVSVQGVFHAPRNVDSAADGS